MAWPHGNYTYVVITANNSHCLRDVPIATEKTLSKKKPYGRRDKVFPPGPLLL